MIKAVVKHSYVKGGKGAGKARAHINYIQYRHGDDRGKEPRAFFDKEDDRITGRHIKDRIDEQDSRGVVMHKIILSPGLETANVQDYTREMMERLEREKGQRLEWFAVEHRNTEHPHAHVVVMGRDLDGGKVRLDLSDMKDLRRWGDRYLEREHAFERYLDREKERLLADKHYTRDRGDALYERLMYGDQGGDRKRSAKEIERDQREWEQLDRDMHKAFSRERSRERKTTWRQYQTESAGRLLTFHEKYQSREARERWEKLAKEDPSLAAAAERELAWMDRYEIDSKLENRGRHDEFDLDRLTDGLERIEREDRRLIDQVMREADREHQERLRETVEHGKSDERDRQKWDLDDLLGPRHQRKDKEQEREQESTVGPSWETFERDRQQQDQMEREDEREKDRERDDDIFGR